MKASWNLIAMSVLLFGAGAAMAQDAGPRERQDGPEVRGMAPGPWGRNEKIEAELLAKVNLTEEQKDAIEALKEQTAKTFQELMDKPGERSDKSSGLRRIRREYQRDLMRILSREQQAQYRELYMEKMKELREAGENTDVPQGRAPQVRLEAEILEQLNLSSEQQQKIEILAKEVAANLRSVMQEPGEQQEKVKARRTVMQTYRKGLMEILTQEQQAQYRELLEQRLKELRKERARENDKRVDQP